jgi:putative sigma-54 modulation protein
MEDRIQVNFRGLKPTDAIKEYINKKLDFLSRFSKYIDLVRVEVSDNKGESLSFKYEITIDVKGGILRVEEKGEDLYSMIDLAHDTLKMKIEKYKERYTDHEKTPVGEMFEDGEDEYNEEEDNETDYKPKITKRKQYSDNRPLHPAEAIDQMEMLGHTSFLFKNIETNKYTMVYKRKDGDYGLMEPESE